MATGVSNIDGGVESSDDTLDKIAEAVVDAALLCRYEGNDSVASDSLRSKLIQAVKREPMVTGRLFGVSDSGPVALAK